MLAFAFSYESHLNRNCLNLKTACRLVGVFVFLQPVVLLAAAYLLLHECACDGFCLHKTVSFITHIVIVSPGQLYSEATLITTKPSVHGCAFQVGPIIC